MVELRLLCEKLQIKKKPGIADGLILVLARKIEGKNIYGRSAF